MVTWPHRPGGRLKPFHVRTRKTGINNPNKNEITIDKTGMITQLAWILLIMGGLLVLSATITAMIMPPKLGLGMLYVELAGAGLAAISVALFFYIAVRRK